MSRFQSSTFSSNMMITNARECSNFVLLVYHGVKYDEVTLSDVNKTKQLLVSAQKVKYKLTGTESAENVYNMMFEDGTVTPTRLHHMIKALTTSTTFPVLNIIHYLNTKLSWLQQNNMMILNLFSQQLTNVLSVACRIQ